MKKILSLCMIFVFLLMPLGSQVTLAEEEKKQEQKGPRISENLFQGHTDEVYKDKYYEIDTETPKKDDKGVLEKLGGYIFGDDSVGQDLQRMIYSTCQWFVNLAFKLNIMLAQLTMFLVDQALKLDIVSSVADKLATAMQNISGIGEDEDGKMGFLSGGLFPSIIGLTCMLSACYAAYIFFVKRQPTVGLNELVKTVFVITFILVFIGNAGTVLKTANTISSEISTTILAKATGTVAGDPNRSQEAAISSVKKQIWGILVERPYLFLQYGEDSKEKIGKDRVDTLLKTPPGQERKTIVDSEIGKGNQMMKMDSVGERIIFTIIYYIVNPFIGLPILISCLLIVAFQLWFLVMSLIAPIVLAVALLPGHRKVLESWVKQWIRPLALKILMSVMLVIIFTVSELIYVLPEAGLAGYVSTMIFQIIVFILCYIFRDNITACFQKTKNIYKTVTDISLMTEHFANRGKEVAVDVGSAAIEGIGDHFNTAAELVAAGEPEPIEKTETKEERERKPHLVKANVPEDLSDYQDKEKQEEKHGRKLIPLKSEEQVEAEEQHATQEEVDEADQKPLARLDQSELAYVMEQTEESTSPVPEGMEDADLPPHYVSLEKDEKQSIYDADYTKVHEEELADPTALDIIEYPTNEMPIEQESTHLPQQEHHTTTLPGADLDVISDDITSNAITPQQEDIHTMLPNDPTALHSVSVPDLIPAKVDEAGRIIPQNTDIDVKSTILQPVVETPTVSTPSEKVSIPDLIPAKVTEQGEILPQEGIEIPSPPVIPDAIAAGSESWNLPTSGPKQLERLEPNKED
ncbi:type IV secretion system protein [Bacillus cereus]|uniref:Type IV secretion system protein n=1 Tax=Bacillus cereus TaxID=1396 RepID=A0AAW5L425_BACCE|nr:type IV secretion system protein [Bacillus cereus]MCQ6289006.1 type IV secretion system protein [Bacillus cereus]MCQ6318477.1 type IV secretion system protein [Bacillus cereus]MCQ6330409.1 type IV secretion system protein [Bacillus cereus]MCQ6386013.1 type IV secretion system protein [Bacillus cereus]